MVDRGFGRGHCFLDIRVGCGLAESGKLLGSFPVFQTVGEWYAWDGL